MADFITVLTLISSTACITVMVLDWRDRRAESKARVDFKAEIKAAGESISQSNTNMALTLKNLLDRMSALEMKNVAGRK